MKKEISLSVSSIEVFFKIIVDWMMACYKLPLTESEKNVFTELLEQNNKLSDIPYEQRMEYLFSLTMRGKMKENLRMKTGTFNNALSSLRHTYGVYGYILIENTINEKYAVYPDDVNILITQIKIKNNDNKTNNPQ